LPRKTDDLVRITKDAVFSKTQQRLNSAQENALEALLTRLSSSRDGTVRGTIAIPTGSGKTRLGAAFLLSLSLNGRLAADDIVLVLAPRLVILNQTRPELKRILKGHGFSIRIPETFEFLYRYKTKLQDLDLLFKQRGAIVVIVLTPQLIHKYVKEYSHYQTWGYKSNRIRAIILDEVHHTYWGQGISETVRTLLGLPSVHFAVGLSATPTMEAIHGVGDIVYSMRTYEAMADPPGILIGKYKIYQADTKIRRWKESDGKSGRITSVSDSHVNEWKVAVPERAEEFARRIVGVLEQETTDSDGHPCLSQRIPKTLVIATNTKEANKLGKYLEEVVASTKGVHMRDPISVAHYNREDHDEVIARFQKKSEGVLVTVDMARMGFDDPNLEALVIARPVGSVLSYIQIRGRVLRKPNSDAADGNIKRSKGYALIVDFTNATRHERYASRADPGYLSRKTRHDNLMEDLGYRKEVEEHNGEVSVSKFKISEFSPPVPKVQSRIAYVSTRGVSIVGDQGIKPLVERPQTHSQQFNKPIRIGDLSLTVLTPDNVLTPNRNATRRFYVRITREGYGGCFVELSGRYRKVLRSELKSRLKVSDETLTLVQKVIDRLLTR
jgi:superfamily II DNA or RNA helicase